MGVRGKFVQVHSLFPPCGTELRLLWLAAGTFIGWDRLLAPKVEILLCINFIYA